MTTIYIDGISSDAQGVGRSDGKVIFVPNTLPGETVEVTEMVKEKSIFKAQDHQLLTAHPERQTPPCPVYEACGGCQLQIAKDTLALALKKRMVQEALQRIGKLNVPVADPIGMDVPYRYRNKGVFHVDDSAGQARLVFYEKKSNQPVPAKDCLLFSEQVNQLCNDFEEMITDGGLVGHIRKVMVRESFLTGDIMVAFVTADPAFRLPQLSERLLQQHPEVKSLWHNHWSNPRLMLGHTWHHLAGETTIMDAIGDKTYHLSPASFFQVNNRQADRLYQAVIQRAALTGQEHIADLYCGIGTIGLALIDRAASLIGVESVGQAIEDAKINARFQNVADKTKFVQAKAELWLPKYLQSGNTIDLAIVDPPRKGLDPRLIETLIKTAIPRIIYVSCNPATLARDLAQFKKANYHINEVQPVDLFPQTAHVECIALIQRQRVKS